MDDELDPHTLCIAASLVRMRMGSVARDPRLDGLERLGATRTLAQLATDLEVSADHIGPPARRATRRRA